MIQSSIKNKKNTKPLEFCKQHKTRLKHLKKNSLPVKTQREKNEEVMRKFVKNKIGAFHKFYDQFKSSKTIEVETSFLFEKLN